MSCIQKPLVSFKLDKVSGWKEVFVEPSPKRTRLILAARTSLAVVWLGVFVWTFVVCPRKGYFFNHLTHWGSALLMVYLLLSAFTTYMARYSTLPDGKGALVPRFATATMALGATVPAIAALICALFWALEYRLGKPVKPDSAAVHGGNMLVILADFLISRRPFSLRHVCLPMAFGLIYGAFTIIHYLVGGTHRDGDERYIYRALDWGHPQQAGTILMGVVFGGIPLFHVTFEGFLHCTQRCRTPGLATRAPGSQASPAPVPP